MSVGEVTRGLFVGAEPPQGTTLENLGFTLLVLATKEHQPPDSAFPGVRVLRSRLKDDGSENAQDVLRGACPNARIVAAALRRGQKVLVTCHWGYNRSAVTAGLALRMLGWSPQDVLAALRRARPPSNGFEVLGSPEYRKAMILGGCP